MTPLASSAPPVIPLSQRCPLCGAPPRPGSVYQNWSLAECASCDMRYLRSGPDGAQVDAGALQNHYQDEAYSASYADPANPYRKEVRGFLDAISRHLFPGPTPPVFCDIGCSVGIALLEAQRRGYRAVGFELSEAAARQARLASGAEVHALDLTKEWPADLPAVDVLYMNHVLEHFVDPVAVLERLKSLSRQGGLLWVNVPNVHSLQRNWLAALGKTSGLALGEHFCHFSWRSLGILLDRVGYEILWRKNLYFDWHWKLWPMQGLSRLARVPDALALVARRIG